MEIICVNDNFPAPVLAFYAEFGVKTPKEDQMYTVRMVKRHTNGETGVPDAARATYSAGRTGND
jgi:hypothetical protein